MLKFAKEQADVTLKYEPFESARNHSDLSKIRLVVMFDASHAAREDHTSQGHLAILVPEEVFEQETPYHVVDWCSYKLPRVARSSLSAEAQAAGGASDNAEYICRFWSIIFDPRPKLRERLQECSPLRPTMVTDAKALYSLAQRDNYLCKFLHGQAHLPQDQGRQTTDLGARKPWPASMSLRTTPMAMLIYFTQIKAVTAEHLGDFMPLAPGDICLADDDPADEWSILSYVSLFILATILIVSS